jgi:hypothetical protein
VKAYFKKYITVVPPQTQEARTSACRLETGRRAAPGDGELAIQQPKWHRGGRVMKIQNMRRVGDISYPVPPRLGERSDQAKECWTSEKEG